MNKQGLIALHYGLFILMGCLVSTSVLAQMSTLVHEDGGGALVYGTYANEGQPNSVNTVPDWSSCGYKGGGVQIPFVPAVVTVNAPTGGDDTALIQNAINTVAGMPLGPDGFRGAVLIKAGNYKVASTININASGIVIRGEGNQATGGTRITMTATVQDNLFVIRGGGYYPSTGSQVAITDTYVPTGSKSFNVSSATAYAPGDNIRIHYKMNAAWLNDIGMDNIIDPVDGDESWTAGEFQLYYDRVVASVAGNTIRVDAPLVQPVETQYGGADVYKLGSSSGLIKNVGIEALRLESTYTSNTDEAHGWIAIWMGDVRDAWVRQVTAKYFGFGCVKVSARCSRVTVEDCAMLDPKSITTGSRKYSFNIDDCQQVLMQRCYTRGGRHDFVSGSKTPGPNAFVDGLAENTFSDTGPHFRWATGELYDNIKCGDLAVQNRWDWGTGHGWAGAQVMFWNCDSSQIICDAPPAAMNWAIGCVGPRKEGDRFPSDPYGIWESLNTHVAPRSLYYRQLEERLGTDALRDIILPSQEAGTIWTGLSTWAGEGLFGDDVIAWASSNLLMPPTNSVSVSGRIRKLQMLDNGATTVWSKVSGPAAGNITFGDASQLETTATFSLEGSYVIRLTVDDGVMTAFYDVEVRYGNAVPIVDAGLDQSVALSDPAPWTPAEISPSAWYDASDAGSLTQSGGVVSQWNDKSDNNNHAAQGNAANRPSIGLAAIGGLNTVSFRVAGQEYLSAPDNASLDLDSSGGANVFAVFDYHGYVNQGSALNVPFSKGQILSSEAAYGIRVSSSSTIGYKAGTDIITSTSNFSSQAILYSGTRNDTTLTGSIYVNGSFGNSTAKASAIVSDNTDPLHIGRDPSGSRFADVDFGEILLVGGTLSEEVRQKLEGYLAHKWGLTGALPADHPYKAATPGATIANATLNGTATDAEGDLMTHRWSLVSGPAPVTIADPSALDTTVSFTEAGNYFLRLTSDDGFGSSYDECVITVGDVVPPTAFEVWAGGGDVTFPGDQNLDGVADGLAWLLSAASPGENANALLPTVLGDNIALEATFMMLNQASRGAAVMGIHYSTDLAEWTMVTIPEVSGTVDGVDFVITPNGRFNAVIATIPLGGPDSGDRVFIRLGGVDD